MTSDPVARYFANRVAQRERQARLRPMRTAELLDASVRVFQAIGRDLLRVSLPASLLILVALGSLTVFVLPEFFGADGTKNFQQQVESAAGSVLITVFAGIPLALIGVSFIAAVCSRMVYDHLVGNSPDVAMATKVALATTPRLTVVVIRIALLASIGIAIAGGIMVAGGVMTSRSREDDLLGGVFILCGFFGGFFGLLWFLWSVGTYAVCPQIAVLEGANVRQTLKRSRELLQMQVPHHSGQGAIWAVYGVLFLLTMAMWVGTAAAFEVLQVHSMVEETLRGSGVEVLASTVLDLLPPFLAIWTLVPLGSVAITMVYFDRRIRLEGLDIELLARSATKRNRDVRFEV